MVMVMVMVKAMVMLMCVGHCDGDGDDDDDVDDGNCDDPPAKTPNPWDLKSQPVGPEVPACGT